MRRWIGVLHLAAGALAISPGLHAAGVAVDYPGLMRSTVDGWIAAQTAGGLFPYGFDFLADQALEPDRMTASNLIRQAGSAYALAAYFRQTGDARLREPILRLLAAFDWDSLPLHKSRAQRWAERIHVLSIPFGRWHLRAALERFGMLYRPGGEGSVVSPDGSYDNALAGTVALALLTELTYADATRDNRFAGRRAAWLRGLLDLRVPGAGFRGAPTSIDESDYFNGEGWLAVAVYHDLHRDDADTAAELADLDQAMIARYTQEPSPHFYHWGAMAAAQRYMTTRDPRFLAFLRSQGETFFSLFEAREGAGDNNCADMEGLAATRDALSHAGERGGALAGRMGDWLDREAAKLPRLQIQPAQSGLALGGQAELRAPRMTEFAGAFLLGLYAPLARIDAAQHCLSAMLMLDRDRREFPDK